jgi:hypothetical protein
MLRDRLIQKLDVLAPDELSSVIDFVDFLNYKKQKSLGQKFRELFRETQALAGVSEITEEDIAAEIAAYRRGENKGGRSKNEE